MDRPRATSPPAAPSEGAPEASTEPPRPSSRPDALLPGTRLEEFEIERVIGTSGFGLVYLANDEAFERRVAIKEYLPDTLAMRGSDGVQVVLRASAHAEPFERGRRAFIEEAQLLARCHHPSLVQVQRHWESNGTVYRAMPFYPGHTLLELRQGMDTPPDEASLRALLDGLLGALDALHAAGALHREIAPQHILLLPDDLPVLLDAGAARRAIVGDQARALMMLLSPSFAPAEQTAPHPDRPVGPWTDLHSLAAVVKYCISGQLPPPASLFTPAPHEPMAAVVERLRATFPNLHYSNSFLASLDAALALHPRDRPRNVAQWRARLDDHPPPALAIESTEPEPAAIDWGEPSEEDRTLGPFYEPQTRPAPLAETPPAEPPTVVAAPVAAPPVDEPAAEEPVATSSWVRPAPAPAPAPATAVEAVDIPVEPLVSVPMPEPASPPQREPLLERPPPLRQPDPFAAFDDDRDAPVVSYADSARRRRRLWAVTSTLLVAIAVGVGAWLVDRQQQSMQAQSDFAQAARHDGLTANVPTVPRAPDEPAAAASAPVLDAPVAAAPAPAPEPAPATAPAPASAEAPLPQAPTAAVAAETPAPAMPTPGINRSGTESAPPATTVAAAAPPAAEETAQQAEPVAAKRSEDDAAAARRLPTTAKATPRTAAAAPRNPPPAAAAKPERTAARAATSPREACGDRTQFSLYRCMQTQCAQDRWEQHPLCKRLRARDEVE